MNDWAKLQVLPAGEKLSARLNNGKKVDGELVAISDTVLTLSKKSKVTEVRREDVAKLYRVLGRHMARSTLKGTAIGASAGAVAGAVAGEDCNRHRSFICFDRSATIPIGAALGAIPGAATGAIIGAFRKGRQLIYEAKVK